MAAAKKAGVLALEEDEWLVKGKDGKVKVVKEKEKEKKKKKEKDKSGGGGSKTEAETGGGKAEAEPEKGASVGGLKLLVYEASSY